jgi:glutamate-1-semialdehyde 2,1-aminomutase
MVTYGKTLGGGLPVGVVCGKRALMKRWREERPADICFARGTFVAHPQVMCAMQVFLEQLDTPAVQALYDGMEERWQARLARLNTQLLAAGLPVQLAGLTTVWTVSYTQPSRYNWMLQFYLRAHGLALSWVGTGRLVFSLDYDDAQFDEVARRFVAACREMREDGWWWSDAQSSNRTIRRGILRELLAHRF